MKRPTEIFFDRDHCSRLLSSAESWLPRYLDLHAELMERFVDPEGPAMQLWSFMPPPAYEGTFGLLVRAGESYAPAFGGTSDGLFLVELAPGAEAGPDAGTEVEIAAPGIPALRLTRRADRTVATLDGASHGLSATEIWISLRRRDGEWVIAVNGTVLGRRPASAGTLAPELRVRTGAAALVMAQSLGPVPAFIFFERPQPGSIVALERDRNPYSIPWGRRQIWINRVLIMAAVLRDLAAAAAAAPGLLDPALHDRLLAADRAHAAFHREYLHAYMAWPRWRSGVGDYPETGPWNRNSFSNGLLPMSTALLARLCPGEVSDEALRQAITTRASAYFLAARRLDFTDVSKGRTDKHWVRRSANHGLIMMFSFLSAARLAGLQDSEAARFVHEIGFASLNQLYSDGSFCEGVHYHMFAMVTCLPYFHQIREDGAEEYRQFLSLLPRVYEWWSLSHDSTGRVFANFGDNVSPAPSRARASVGQFLKYTARADLGESPDLDLVDATTPFFLPGARRAAPATGLISRVYKTNKFALSAFVNDAGQRESGLFVIGSRLQATHNHNHDATGFAFYAPGWRIAIDRPDRQPTGNNGVIFLDDKGRQDRIRGWRDYSGTVAFRAQDAPDQALFHSATKPITLTLSSAGTVRIALERWFLYRPKHPCPLAIVTRIAGEGAAARPALAFNLMAEAGHDVPAAGAALWRGPRGWEDLAAERFRATTVWPTGSDGSGNVLVLNWFGTPEGPPGQLAGLFPLPDTAFGA